MTEQNFPKAVLLDMDDTLVSHTAGTEELWRTLCHRHAVLIEGLSPDLLYTTHKDTRKHYWSDIERHRTGRLNLKATRREIVALTFSRLGIYNTEISNSIADSFTEQREDLVYLFEGVHDTLRRLKERGIKLGLITNGASQLQRAKIEKFGLEPFFDCITIEEEFGQGKPEPQVFLHTLEKLKVEAEDAWMTGDDLIRDIAGANNTGIYSIWIDLENKGLPVDSPVKPGRIIQSISQLL